ncbi:hypothetical protein [Mycobacterium sp. 48b]
MFRALVVGTLAGLGLSGLLMWAFAEGCPIFDAIRDTDTTHPF